MSTIVFTRDRSRLCRGPDQASPRPLLPYFLWSILILFFHLHAGFQEVYFPAGFPTTTVYAPLLIRPLSGNSSTYRCTTYQGTTDILEPTTSTASILADQLIKITLFYTCQCVRATRSGSNLANNDKWGVDVQISTSLTPSKWIKHNVKNASSTKHFSIVLSITLKYVGNRAEVNALKINDTRKESHSTRLNSIQRPDLLNKLIQSAPSMTIRLVTSRRTWGDTQKMNCGSRHIR